MTEPKRTDDEELAAALKRIHGVDVPVADLLAHEMRPAHVERVSSDRGRLDLPDSAERHVFPRPPTPVVRYVLDVDGFVQALESALNNEVARSLSSPVRRFVFEFSERLPPSRSGC